MGGSLKQRTRDEGILRSAGLALLLLFSGCAADPGGPQSSTGAAGPRDGPIELAPGVWVAPDRGALQGTVIDDAGFPVRGARISLLATDLFADSDASGAYRFLNLTPGTVSVQATSPGFSVFLEDAEIRAANLTNLTIRLLPEEGRGAGYRPHLHDLWGGRTEVVMKDEDFDPASGKDFRGGTSLHDPYRRAIDGVYAPNEGNRMFLIPIKSRGPEDPNLVYRGAGRIEVTFTWGPASCTLDKIGLAYSGPSIGQVKLAPQASGTKFTIAVNDTLADTGHQAWTFWRFWLNYDNSGGDGANFRPGATLGPIRVKIVVFKDHEPTPEPPHEDFWGNATELLLRVGSGQSGYGATPTYRDGTELLLPSKKIVPPGTAKLRFNFTYTLGAAEQALKPSGYKVIWRSGDQNPYEVKWSQYHDKAPLRQGTTSNGGWRLYEIDLLSAQTDAFYQTRSNWAWSPVEPGKENEPEDWGTNNSANRVFTLEVIAIRGDAPEAA